MEPINKKIVFKDVFGNKLEEVICKDCKINITTMSHHRSGFCMSCAFKRGLI